MSDRPNGRAAPSPPVLGCLGRGFFCVSQTRRGRSLTKRTSANTRPASPPRARPSARPAPARPPALRTPTARARSGSRARRASPGRRKAEAAGWWALTWPGPARAPSAARRPPPRLALPHGSAVPARAQRAPTSPRGDRLRRRRLGGRRAEEGGRLLVGSELIGSQPRGRGPGRGWRAGGGTGSCRGPLVEKSRRLPLRPAPRDVRSARGDWLPHSAQPPALRCPNPRPLMTGF